MKSHKRVFSAAMTGRSFETCFSTLCYRGKIARELCSTLASTTIFCTTTARESSRRRGVDVRVIVPLVTDRGPITRNNVLAANAMLQQGIRVYVYPGMSHVKAALFDGWACLGTANWDRLSFRINKELNIATSHPEAVERLKTQLFEKDFERSVEITEPFPERWSDHLLEILGDYIF